MPQPGMRNRSGELCYPRLPQLPSGACLRRRINFVDNGIASILQAGRSVATPVQVRPTQCEQHEGRM
jgi:hypothetical protein